jgi:hypothetical protein
MIGEGMIEFIDHYTLSTSVTTSVITAAKLSAGPLS